MWTSSGKNHCSIDGHCNSSIKTTNSANPRQGHWWRPAQSVPLSFKSNLTMEDEEEPSHSQSVTPRLPDTILQIPQERHMIIHRAPKRFPLKYEGSLRVTLPFAPSPFSGGLYEKQHHDTYPYLSSPQIWLGEEGPRNLPPPHQKWVYQDNQLFKALPTSQIAPFLSQVQLKYNQ